MTHPDLLKIKAIAAILEAIEADDEKDAKTALRMIEALMGTAEK
jgi:hypothetical protein